MYVIIFYFSLGTTLFIYDRIFLSIEDGKPLKNFSLQLEHVSLISSPSSLTAAPESPLLTLRPSMRS
jgi:hypothetical protein